MSEGSVSVRSGGEPPALGNTLASARKLLAAIAGGASFANPDVVMANLGRVEQAYDDYPELELEYPRSRLVDAVLSALGEDDGAVAMALLFCIAIQPWSPRPLLSPLLRRLTRLGWDEVAVAVIRVLSRDRDLNWNDLALAIAQLRQNGRADTILAMLSEALDALNFIPDQAALDFGTTLRQLLTDEDTPFAEDPAVFAAIASSARRRVQQARMQPPLYNDSEDLLSLAGRVVAKMGPPPEAPLELPARLAWPSRQLSLGEFVSQHQTAIGLAIEHLPNMKVGGAGERDGTAVHTRMGESGHVIYGPYCHLPLGTYQLDIELAISPPRWRWLHRSRRIAAIEVVSDNGDRWLAQRNVYLRDHDERRHSLRFAVETAQRKRLSSPIEFRLWTSGTLPLTIASVKVTRVSELDSGAGRAVLR